jgi:putative transposase
VNFCFSRCNRDHVHMLIGIPPQISVLRAVHYLKRKSSHKLLSENAGLRKRIGTNTFGRVGMGWLRAAT